MTFADLPAGAAIFLDANVLVYYFSAHSAFGPACQQLVKRIETGEIAGHTSTAVLSELAHRLMTLEAMMRFGWTSKVVDRLKRNPSSVGQLSRFRQAVARIPQLQIRVLTIPVGLVEAAADISQQHRPLEQRRSPHRRDADQQPDQPRQPRQRLRSRVGPDTLRPCLIVTRGAARDCVGWVGWESLRARSRRRGGGVCETDFLLTPTPFPSSFSLRCWPGLERSARPGRVTATVPGSRNWPQPPVGPRSCGYLQRQEALRPSFLARPPEPDRAVLTRGDQGSATRVKDQLRDGGGMGTQGRTPVPTRRVPEFDVAPQRAGRQRPAVGQDRQGKVRCIAITHRHSPHAGGDFPEHRPR